MAPYLAPHSHPATQGDGSHLVFVPVPGAVVFCVCLLLICACVVWMCLLCAKGIEHDKEA